MSPLYHLRLQESRSSAEGRGWGRDIGLSRAVFLSYASEDSEAAGRICEALRAAGIEVWFDKSERRGGDAWDRLIRERIRDCRIAQNPDFPALHYELARALIVQGKSAEAEKALEGETSDVWLMLGKPVIERCSGRSLPVRRLQN